MGCGRQARGCFAWLTARAFVCAAEQQPDNLLLLLLVTTLCSSLTFVLPREAERAESIIAKRTRRRLIPGPLRRGSQVSGAGYRCCPAQRRGLAYWSPGQRTVGGGAPPPRSRSKPRDAEAFFRAPGTWRELCRPPVVRSPEGRRPVSAPMAASVTSSVPMLCAPCPVLPLSPGATRGGRVPDSDGSWRWSLA